MKKLIPLIPPVVKAILTVVGFMVGLGWGAYQAVSQIARAEAKIVGDQVKEIRSLDMEHLNKRFDRLEELIKDSK
jgi:hypothetical protein